MISNTTLNQPTFATQSILVVVAAADTDDSLFSGEITVLLFLLHFLHYHFHSTLHYVWMALDACMYLSIPVSV